MYRERKALGFKSDKFIDILLCAYDDITSNPYKKNIPYVDNALEIALKIHKEPVGKLLDGIIHWHSDKTNKDEDLYLFICGNFCKSFRQTDVIEDGTRGLSDMLMWNLINAAELLDHALKATCMYYQKYKNGEWNKYLLTDCIDDTY